MSTSLETRQDRPLPARVRVNDTRIVARILIAEDNVLVRWTLVTLLQSWGYDVEPVATGHQALQRFADLPADVVVLDAHMPGMDGLEVCKLLRRQSAVPIVMMSTLSHTAVRDQALASGANAFWTKPLQVDHLQASVRRLCEGIDRLAPTGGLEIDCPDRTPLPKQAAPPSRLAAITSLQVTAGPLPQSWGLRSAPAH